MFSFWKKLDSAGKIMMFFCLFAYFTNGCWNALQGSILPDLKNVCSMSETVSGTIISAQSIGSLVGGFALSLLAIKIGRKNSMFSILIIGIGGIIMLLTKSPLSLFFAYLLIGFGKGGLASFASETVNHLSDGSSSAQNVVTACFAAGAIITPMVYLFCQRLISWKAGIAFAAIIGCIALLLSLKTTNFQNKEPLSHSRNHSFGFLKESGFLILSAAMFFYLCAEFAINGWLVTYLQNKPELTGAFSDDAALEAYSQMASTLLWVVILIGRLLCAFLGGKVNAKKLLLYSSVGIAFFFAIMVFSRNILSVTIAIAGLGLCMSGVYPLISAEAAPYMEKYSLAVSTLQAIGYGGAALMPVIVGLVASNIGFNGGMFTILIGILLLVVFCFIHLIKNKVQQ